MNQPTDQAEADYEVEPPGEDSSVEESHAPEELGTSTLDDYQSDLDALEAGQIPEGFESAAPSDEEPAPEEEEEPSDSEEEGAESEDQEEDPEPEEEEEETAPTEEPEGEEPPASKAGRFRIRTDDPVEAEALELRKRHPDWSLDTCLSKAKDILGVAEAPSDDPDDSTEPEGERRTVADAKQELKDLRAKRAQALRDVELDEAADLDLKIDALVDEMDDLRTSEAEHHRQQEEAFTASVRKSESKAVNYYPDVTKAESPLVLEMQRIDQQLKATDNPLFSDPDKPFKLAQMAANTLGIAPTDPSRPAAPPAKKASSRRPVHQPASGKARSTVPATPPSKAEEAIDGLDTLDDYEEFVGND